jgi:hypothetical protein
MAQSVKQEQRKDHYGRIAKDIAMPAENEIPPVLADNPSDWGGNSQPQQMQQQEQPVQEQYEEAEQEQYAQGDSDQVIDDSSDEQEEVQEAPRQKASPAQESWKMLREQLREEKRKNDELVKYMMQQQSNPQHPPKPQVEEQDDTSYPDYDLNIDDDAIAEGKQLKKIAEANKRLVQDLKEIKKELKRVNSQQNQSQESIVEGQLRAQYPDLDAVVNPNTLEQLKREYPEIAATIRTNPDLHARATTAYNVIKKFGIYKDRSFEMAKVNVNKNVNKPRPVSSLNPQQGESPLSKANAFANGLTDDLKKQMLKEMTQARKNL